MSRRARPLFAAVLFTILGHAGGSACGMESSNDVYMQGLELEGQAERSVCRLVYDTGAKAHVLDSGKVKDCLDRNRAALERYEKADEMGQTGLDFQHKLEDARERVKKLESMYKMVKMMETDQTLERVGAPRDE